MTTHQHSGANFDESVVWFMCALDVPAMGHTRRNALWCAAEIQIVIRRRALDGAI